MKFHRISWMKRAFDVAVGLCKRFPPLCWFSNDVPLVLVKPDGSLVMWQAGQGKVIALHRAKRKSFWAIELPEDMVLVRRLDIPIQDPAEKSAATALAVQMASPFAPEDGVWGVEAFEGRGRFLAVMASRSQIAAYAQRLSQAHGIPAVRDPGQCEVWFFTSARDSVVLSGFAEPARRGQTRRNRWLSYVFFAFGALITAAILTTPLAQLALEVDSAQSQYRVAQVEAQPAQAVREAMLATQAKLVALSKISLENQHPPEILARVTAVVPDDTWVQRLQWQSGKVTLQGQTPNVATLMASLSRQPDIKEVKAPSAATKSVGSGKENFTVEFVLLPTIASVIESNNSAGPEKAVAP